MAETALVLLVPEAEPLVQAWRAQHDPVAVRGMPAHVTLVYPFLPVERLTAETEAAVAALFQARPPLQLALTACRRFPGVLWLAPEPGDAVIGCVERLVARFPEAPPYGGRFQEIVPHLTVAHVSGPDAVDVLDRIERALASGLPLQASVDRAVLYVEEGGFWRPRTVFPFGGM
jgi:2'-5' RNA ligase